jgi:hypothetical protein
MDSNSLAVARLRKTIPCLLVGKEPSLSTFFFADLNPVLTCCLGARQACDFSKDDAVSCATGSCTVDFCLTQDY